MRLATVVLAILMSCSTCFCPLHSYAPCYFTGQISPTGSGARLYKCSCGDSVWVK